MSPRSILALTVVLALAHWSSEGYSAETTYAYTVYATGVPSNLMVPIFLDGVMNGSIAGGGSRTFTFGAGTTHSIRVEQYVAGPTGIRFFCASPAITVSGNGAYTFTYRTQYYLTISTPYGKAAGEGWKDSGIYAQASLETGQLQPSAGIRHTFIAWGGDASGSGLTSNQILMDAPKIAVANWKTQYLLTIKTEPAGIDSSGGGWYDSGSTSIFSVVSPTSGTPGSRYLFTGWSGNFTGSSPSASIVMDSPKTVVANFKTQYRLQVQTSPPGLANITGTGWRDVGETVSVGAAPSLISGGTGKRYVFTGWTVDGSGAGAGPISVVMNAPRTVVANYKTQYFLSVKSPYGNAQGEGWYDEGTAATFSVAPTHSEGWLRYVFEKWLGDSAAATPTATILMDSPKFVSAIYRSDYTMLYLYAGAFAAIGIGGAVAGLKLLPRTRFFRRSGPVQGPQPPQGGIPYIPAATVVHTVPDTTISAPSPLQTMGAEAISHLGTCASCGAEMPAGAYFCDRCGTRVDVAEEGLDPFDEKVFEYILAHDGTISFKKAAEELGTAVEQVKGAAERLKRAGRLG